MVLCVLPRGLPGHRILVFALLSALIPRALIGRLVSGAMLAALALLALTLLSLCGTAGALPVLLTLLREGYAARCEQRKCATPANNLFCFVLIMLSPSRSGCLRISPRTERSFPAAMHLANADSLAKFLQTVRVIFRAGKEVRF